MRYASINKLATLPLELRRFLAAPETLTLIDRLEKRYRVKLAYAVIQLAVGDLTFREFPAHLIRRFQIQDQDAQAIAREIEISILQKLRVPPRPAAVSEPAPHPAAPAARGASSLPDAVLQASASVAPYQEAMAAAEQRIAASTQYDPKAVVAELVKAFMGNDGIAIVACLFLLGRMGALADLASEQQIQAVIEREIIPQLARSLPRATPQGLAAAFRAHPEKPVWIRELLRLLLVRALKGNEGEAARVGAQLENLLTLSGGKDFRGMVVFDAGKGVFAWEAVKSEEIA